jgi:uncharacterized membrane protein YcaP (DUF421 family)
MNIDWYDAFALGTPPLEIFVRGTVTYFSIFLLFRVVLKREIGGMSVNDLLVLVLVADAAQNAMADDYHSITDGLLLVATLVFWSLALDWLTFRSRVIEDLVKPRPLAIIRNGRILHRHLRREFISIRELESAAREQGIDDLSAVKACYVESDGRLSFIRKEEDDKGSSEGQQQGGGQGRDSRIAG